ncbi:hypothetical protein P175DRAFT_0501936 [Aspergillus ochraceoroseus IBT 24754]|uniref:RNA 3'-terminal phosphate cyclase domain-containing protein n=3 Tax=Aspergillus subgen. Nidulantes TaxID=2720870 RepID=A0A0F8UT44_9EURO|nr:uncharacterized protein P175DRAFT_0501936 [Aspergillus ochraceoroseus IBT 24754]KKK14011.1 hypothetical protein ARAM_006255 [Aspergillus rambellii]KKK17622.1 hypothetical protein AOCH_006674 [Aspergillus ochraceoroseus]PTU19772.1 hypothetical protein P175DRAFT_0501936 [Aspergillus ochraceoroseus IBT 24754]
MAPAQPTRVETTIQPIRLDGRTLEGGGQLVRIAIALSALTGQPITIDHIRGNRSGKKGLKNSHLAAINCLGEMSGSTLVGAQVDSPSLGFYPPPPREESITDSSHEDGPLSKREINIRLPTVGSIFLVFQALYPCLLHCGGSTTPDNPIYLSITGGTNVSFSPSYDYVSQVLIPNFARCGLPRLSADLEKRGWLAGARSLGKVTFRIETLPRDRDTEASGDARYWFPLIDLNQYDRGTISKIDITVLAPDGSVTEEFERGSGKNKKANKGHRRTDPRIQNHNYTTWEEEKGTDAGQRGRNLGTVREFMESETYRLLRKRLRKIPSSIFSPREPSSSSSVKGPEEAGSDEDAVRIDTHTTEATYSRSCLYVLIVAHTSTGFKIGRDALYRGDGKKRTEGRDRGGMIGAVTDLVEDCVEGFIQELYNPTLQSGTPCAATRPPCVDEYMRDQLVVFEALGRMSRGQINTAASSKEDERYWSLHTRTAQWVCREMLGEDSLG